MKLNPIQLAGPSNAASGYFYEDALAIYQAQAGSTWTGQPADPENTMEMVLKDATGSPLYVNFNVPYQFAADPTSRAWQSRYVEWGLSQRRLYGYWGLLSDDVNFTLDTVVNVAGVQTVPILAGESATAETWAAAMVNYMSIVHAVWKAIFPDAKLIHNTPWWKANPEDFPNADYIMKEQGFSDGGLQGGAGQFSLDALFRYCDQIHAAGKGVHILENGAHSASDQEFSLACSLLMTNGGDLWEDRVLTAPANVFADVGAPVGPRVRSSNGLWIRIFSGATVFALEPGANPLTAGAFSLQPRQGIILQS